MPKPLVAVIGAGQVGATTAQRLIEKNIAHVVLFDIVEGLAEGKALDLMEASPVEAHPKTIKGTTHYADIAGADIVVVTAGIPRKPGMTREDLLLTNAKIIRSVCENVKQYAPDSILIIVTNPLDIMTEYAARITGFEKHRVLGMAGVLDSARMRYFIAEKAGVIPSEVEAMVLGGHGDLMVPVMSQVTVKGKKFTLPEPESNAIIQRTRDGGAEIVKLLKTGSAFYAPASSVALMVEVILNDGKKVLPCCVWTENAYGIKNGYCGLPARLGRKGVLGVEPIPLTPAETKALAESADKVKKGVDEVMSLASQQQA